MDKNYFITITGTKHYYGMKPFEINRIIKLVKEPDNEFDTEAIRAELPFIEKIGYVANSPNTLAKGTVSAGRLYDTFEDDCFARVLFVTTTKVICMVLFPEDSEQATEETDGEKAEQATEVGTESKEIMKDKIINNKKPKSKIGFVV